MFEECLKIAVLTMDMSRSSVGTYLSFLQNLIDKCSVFATIKVYLAPVTAYHVRFGGLTASQHPLICCFMKSARLLLPVPPSAGLGPGPGGTEK